ncbi:MAG: ABC transporter permease, partial [Actinomycetota bacterium]|nr:ABC transporter permease [Actinomycetota bacterium]
VGGRGGGGGPPPEVQRPLPPVSRVADPAPAGSGVVTDPVIATGPADSPGAEGPADAARRRRRPWWVPVAGYLATVFALLTLNFAIPRLMPGDPIDALMAFGSPTYVHDDETRSALATYYQLDEPLVGQYVSYLSGLARGDLGVSIYNNTPVSTDLGGKVGWSFLLIATATVISVAIGIPLGVHSGWKRGKRVDRRLLGFFLAYQNLPIFVIGSAAFIVLTVKLGLFPYGGGSTPFNEYTGLEKVVDVGRHLALPAIMMGLDAATYQYLVMRSSMVGELGSDYLLLGQAKGVRERRLKYRYAGRNALLPVVSVIGLQFSLAITSVIFIERIFAYPGLGNYMFQSVAIRDYPAIQGAFLVLTVTVVTVNLVVDLLYRRLDPRTAR